MGLSLAAGAKAPWAACRIWLALAALNGLMGVAAGALGAHGASRPRSRPQLQTGAQYQIAHAVAAWPATACCRGMVTWAGLGGLAVRFRRADLRRLALCAGARPACGSMGAITPIGGVLLLAGWAVLVWGALAGLATE